MGRQNCRTIWVSNLTLILISLLIPNLVEAVSDGEACTIDDPSPGQECDNTNTYLSCQNDGTGAFFCHCDPDTSFWNPTSSKCNLKYGQACTPATGQPCDTHIGFTECIGESGQETCVCNPDTSVWDQNLEKCFLTFEAECVSASQRKCDPNAFLTCQGGGGLQRCRCAPSVAEWHEPSKKCVLNHDEVCGTTEQQCNPDSFMTCVCDPDQYMTCMDMDGVSKCGCDAGNSIWDVQKTMCGLKLGQICEATSQPCLTYSNCPAKPNPVCVCDEGLIDNGLGFCRSLIGSVFS